MAAADLRDAIREAASSRAWSQGVTLAREDRISGRSASKGEQVVEVRVPTRPTPYTVVLYFDDEEWDCDCGSREAACSHACAAAIVAAEAAAKGVALPVSKTAGAAIGYRLAPDPAGLALTRVAIEAGRETPITTSVQSSAAGRGPKLATTEADLLVDQLLGTRPDAPIGADRVDRLLQVLADVADVRFAGQPVKTSGEVVTPRAILSDAGDGVVVRLEAPTGARAVSLGVARIGDTLHPIGAIDLGGARFEHLPAEQRFRGRELGAVATTMVPALAARIPIEIRTRRLPSVARGMAPRVMLDVVQRGESLSIMAIVVYGDPPVARVDGDRLVHLGGDVPVRDLDGLRAWQDGLPLAALRASRSRGGGWAPLPTDWLSRYGARVADLLVARRDDGKVERAALPALAELCDALEYPRPKSFDKLAPIIEGFDRIPEAPLPPTSTRRCARTSARASTGSASSATPGSARARRRHGPRQDAPGALRDAGPHARRVPAQRRLQLGGRDREVPPRPEASPSTTARGASDRSLRRRVITTYAVLRLDADALSKEEWDVRRPRRGAGHQEPRQPGRARRLRAARRAPGRALRHAGREPPRGAVEPAPLHEPGPARRARDFDERWARRSRPATTRPRPRPSAPQVRPFVLRRLKRDVAPELPPRTDQVLYCELTTTSATVYDAVRAATQQAEVVEQARRGQRRAGRARGAPAAAPGGVSPGAVARAARRPRRRSSASSSARRGRGGRAQGAGVLAVDVAPRSRRAAPDKAEGIGFTRLDGSTRDRAGWSRRSRRPNGPPVMLISLKAGGTGLNLTAADHVFLLDPWWNPAVEDQAADRAHRIGQDKPVIVHKLVAKDTVEEGISPSSSASAPSRTRPSHVLLRRLVRATPPLTRDDLLALRYSAYE
jgi:hypothetical protein